MFMVLLVYKICFWYVLVTDPAHAQRNKRHMYVYIIWYDVPGTVLLYLVHVYISCIPIPATWYLVGRTSCVIFRRWRRSEATWSRNKPDMFRAPRSAWSSITPADKYMPLQACLRHKDVGWQTAKLPWFALTGAILLILMQGFTINTSSVIVWNGLSDILDRFTCSILLTFLLTYLSLRRNCESLERCLGTYQGGIWYRYNFLVLVSAFWQNTIPITTHQKHGDSAISAYANDGWFQ